MSCSSLCMPTMGEMFLPGGNGTKWPHQKNSAPQRVQAREPCGLWRDIKTTSLSKRFVENSTLLYVTIGVTELVHQSVEGVESQ